MFGTCLFFFLGSNPSYRIEGPGAVERSHYPEKVALEQEHETFRTQLRTATSTAKEEDAGEERGSY